MVLSASAVNIDNLFAGDNTNFEGGTVGQWFGWSGAPAPLAPGFESEYCLHVQVNATAANPWDNQIAYDFPATLEPETYHLKFMAKGTGTIQPVLQSESYGDQVYGPEFNLTDEWQEFTAVMVVTATTDIQFRINYGKATEVFMDNIEFGLEEKIIPADDYYLYNVEAGAFLAGGNDWGTRASLKEHGYKFGLASVEGGYTLDSYTYNNATDHFLGTNGYVDAPAATWTIKPAGKYTDPVSEKEYVTYTISNNGNFVGNQDGNFVSAELTDGKAAAAQWVLISKNDLLDAFNIATQDYQVDATFLIDVPNFSRNHKVDGNVNPWQVSADCTNKNLSGGDNTNMCAESWHSTFDIYQEINDVPNGYYTLSIQGFCRQDADDTTPFYFYINDAKQPVDLLTGTENSMGEASAAFTNGLYYQKPLTVQVTDGKLRVGIKNETNTTMWAIWDNFELSYSPVDPSVETMDNVLVGANGQVVPVSVEVGSKASVVTPFDADAVAQALGVTDLRFAYKFAINASTAYSLDDVVYLPETGYRNINGDVCDEDGAAVGVNVLANGKIIVTPISLPAATAPAMNVYDVFVANDTAYLLTTQITFEDSDPDGATSINNLKANVEGGIIYDLTGRKVSSVKAGQVYIVNGKKVLLK